MEAVLCYPRGTTLGASGVTRASWEFLPAQQDAAGEAAPGAFASLAAMRAATGQGSRYYFDPDSGLLFLRVRQAAGWGGSQPDGYCPPGGCAALVVHAVPAGAAPTPQQCEARLAALPGAAPTGDAFLAATLPAPLFDLPAACPQLPMFGCDCWGQTGCAGKACTAPERASCDASGASGATTAAAKPAASSPPPATKAKPPPPHTSALLKSKPQKTPSPSPPPPRPPSPRPPPPSPRPSPNPPPPSPPPPPPPIDWGTPLLVSNFASGALDRTLFDVEQDCWGGGNCERLPACWLRAASPGSLRGRLQACLSCAPLHAQAGQHSVIFGLMPS